LKSKRATGLSSVTHLLVGILQPFSLFELATIRNLKG
jgi:hypothetical protein